MKIKRDVLQIASGAMAVDGTKLEPEQQPARRVVTVDAPVALGQGTHGQNVGSMPVQIVTESQNAGDLAEAMTHLCGNCKWFRNQEWIRDLKNADSPMAPMEQRRAINEIRGALLSTQNANLADMHTGQDGDLDVEAALHQLGYCKALYEFNKNRGESNEDATVLVHPLSCCPADIRKHNPPGGFFVAKDNEAKRVGGKNKDRIMRQAQGK